jgi:glycerol-3-phosphate acyltransferase PlsY
LAVSFGVGAIPFSGLAARLLAGVDLRQRGSGTVSGTALYEVTGFGPLAVAGSLDVAKGAVGPLIAGSKRPFLRALAAGAAVTGHNWSPFLGGAGGRGISTAMGATLVTAPEAAVVLGGSLGLGRLVRQTGLACFAGIVALFPVLARRRGLSGVVLAGALAGPMLGKRVVGNEPPHPDADRRKVVLWRLLFDRDPAKT